VASGESVNEIAKELEVRRTPDHLSEVGKGTAAVRQHRAELVVHEHPQRRPPPESPEVVLGAFPDAGGGEGLGHLALGAHLDEPAVPVGLAEERAGVRAERLVARPDAARLRHAEREPSDVQLELAEWFALGELGRNRGEADPTARAEKPRGERVQPDAPGAPVMAYIDGDISLGPAMEGDGQIPTVSVRRFIGLFPDQSCARTLSTASLTNTYWRMVTLGGQAVVAMQGHREPHLLLRTAQGQYVATAGCNQLSGGYEVSGSRIDLHPGVATRMACPGALESLEQQLVATLGAARAWRLHAQVLELFDAEGVSIATLEAVYLP